MDESHNSHETDVARLLGDHHEEIEMDVSFRNRLLQGTRNVVAARTGRRFRRALALVAAVAAAVAALMLWGPPGVGKSQIVAQVAEKHTVAIVDIRLSQMEPSDLRGIPFKNNHKVF